MFSRSGVTEAGKKLWKQKLRRMYEKNIGLRRKIASSMRFGDFPTPAGIYLGRAMTVGYDEHRLEAVAKKIVRGLYFHERGVPLDTTADLVCLFLREAAHFNAVKQHNHMLNHGSKLEGHFAVSVRLRSKQSAWFNVAPLVLANSYLLDRNLTTGTDCNPG